MSLLSRRQNNSLNPDATGLSRPVVSEETGTRLTGLKLDGQISALEDMYIDVDVNGPITSDSKLVIGPHGSVRGNVKAREIIILGQVDGDVEATESVSLRDGAEVRGDIYTFHIGLSENAVFKGKVDCRSTDAEVRPIPPAREVKAAVAQSLSA